MQGYKEDAINNSAFEFIEIYAYFECFGLSYKYMVSMAIENSIWIYINDETFKWACERYEEWQVINIMEHNLKDNKISYENIENYKEYINQLKNIRGF